MTAFSLFSSHFLGSLIESAHLQLIRTRAAFLHRVVTMPKKNLSKKSTSTGENKESSHGDAQKKATQDGDLKCEAPLGDSDSPKEKTKDGSKSELTPADRMKKLPKILNFLFTSNGLATRNIMNRKGNGGVSFFIKDFTNTNFDQYRQFTLDDFQKVVPESAGDLKAKDLPNYLLISVDGEPAVLYLEKGSTSYTEQLKQSVSSSAAAVAESMPREDGLCERSEKSDAFESQSHKATPETTTLPETMANSETTAPPDTTILPETTAASETTTVPITMSASETMTAFETTAAICETTCDAVSLEPMEVDIENKDSETDDHWQSTKGKKQKSRSDHQSNGSNSGGGDKSKKKQNKAAKSSDSDVNLPVGKVDQPEKQSSKEKNLKTNGEISGPSEKQSTSESEKMVANAERNKDKNRDEKKLKSSSKGDPNSKADEASKLSREGSDDDVSTSVEGPKSKKSKHKTDEHVLKLLGFLFGERNGLAEKKIEVEEDGSVSILTLQQNYQDYDLSEERMVTILKEHPTLECCSRNDHYYVKPKLVEIVEKPASQHHQMQRDQHESHATREKGHESSRGASNYSKSRSQYGNQGSRDNYSQGSRQYSQGSRDNYSQGSRQCGQGSQPYNQGAPRYNQRPRESEDDIYLSKTMSFVLRHAAERFHIPIQPDGYMRVEDLLRFKDLNYYSQDDVRRVVENNDKKRFEITFDGDVMKVRANQGHTMAQVNELEMTEITADSEISSAVHGTYLKHLSQIRRMGLSRMSRNHIHMARGEPGESGVISGMRYDCEVAIYVDVSKAIKDGLQFFLSANDVILCPGNEQGVLPPQYFSAIINRRTKEKIQL